MLRRAEPIRSVIERTLRQLGIYSRFKEADAVRIFAEVVGEQIAKHAEAKSIRNGELLIKVSSPTWRQQLSFQKQEMIARLNTALGTEVVKEIRFSS